MVKLPNGWKDVQHIDLQFCFSDNYRSLEVEVPVKLTITYIIVLTQTVFSI